MTNVKQMRKNQPLTDAQQAAVLVDEYEREMAALGIDVSVKQDNSDEDDSQE